MLDALEKELEVTDLWGSQFTKGVLMAEQNDPVDKGSPSQYASGSHSQTLEDYTAPAGSKERLTRPLPSSEKRVSSFQQQMSAGQALTIQGKDTVQQDQ